MKTQMGGVPLVTLEAMVRAAAFRLLIRSGEGITPESLAQVTGIAGDRLAVLLDDLVRAGRIRRDGAGRVVGSAGLSVVPDRHEIKIEGRRFWTWCAYDILGIFGALQASGRASSPDPQRPRCDPPRFHRRPTTDEQRGFVSAGHRVDELLRESLRRMVSEQQSLRGSRGGSEVGDRVRFAGSSPEAHEGRGSGDRRVEITNQPRGR
jgi:hypothetical protein